MTAAAAPPLRGILETAVYVDDLARARAFYGGVLALDCVLDTPRMLAFRVAPCQMLLVFRRGETRADTPTAGGMVPGHHGEGPAHFALFIDAADYDAWKRHLDIHRIAVTSEVAWPRGGRSLYLADPDANVVELATGGLWPGC